MFEMGWYASCCTTHFESTLSLVTISQRLELLMIRRTIILTKLSAR